MKPSIKINYDDWKTLESNSTGLPIMNNELIEAIAKLASNESIVIVLTIENNPAYILKYDTSLNLFTEHKIES